MNYFTLLPFVVGWHHSEIIGNPVGTEFLRCGRILKCDASNGTDSFLHFEVTRYKSLFLAHLTLFWNWLEGFFGSSSRLRIRIRSVGDSSDFTHWYFLLSENHPHLIQCQLLVDASFNLFHHIICSCFIVFWIYCLFAVVIVCWLIELRLFVVWIELILLGAMIFFDLLLVVFFDNIILL